MTVKILNKKPVVRRVHLILIYNRFEKDLNAKKCRLVITQFIAFNIAYT